MFSYAGRLIHIIICSHFALRRLSFPVKYFLHSTFHSAEFIRKVTMISRELLSLAFSSSLFRVAHGEWYVRGTAQRVRHLQDFMIMSPMVNATAADPDHLYPLGRCQGDCDVDSHCQGGLRCYQRDANAHVPGCTGGEQDGTSSDYCIRLEDFPEGATTSRLPSPSPVPSTTPSSSASENLSTASNSSHIQPRGELTVFPDPITRPLGLCQGDCDSDEDCEDGLICWMRNAGDTPIPFCNGPVGTSRTDFCVYANAGTATPFAGASQSPSFPSVSPSPSSAPSYLLSATISPSHLPSLSLHNKFPSSKPTVSVFPTFHPTASTSPSVHRASHAPSPSSAPSHLLSASISPSHLPSASPSKLPSNNKVPSSKPTVSAFPTFQPTKSKSPSFPSVSHAPSPSSTPSHLLSTSISPSHLASASPSKLPTKKNTLSSEPTVVSPFPTFHPTTSTAPSISDAPPTILIPLVDFGALPPSDKKPITLCQGDCDDDGDCVPGLICLKRRAGDDVPGCQGDFSTSSNFCIRSKTFAPLIDYGEIPPDVFKPLRLCEGNCHDDSDCGDGLVCKQRVAGDDIEGCDGDISSESDFCVWP